MTVETTVMRRAASTPVLMTSINAPAAGVSQTTGPVMGTTTVGTSVMKMWLVLVLPLVGHHISLFALCVSFFFFFFLLVLNCNDIFMMGRALIHGVSIQISWVTIRPAGTFIFLKGCDVWTGILQQIARRNGFWLTCSHY